MFLKIHSLVLLLCFACFASIFAQESAQDFFNPLLDPPPHNEYISTFSYIPDHPEHRLPLGEPTTILCHFANDSPEPMNVTGISSVLTNPDDFGYLIQRFGFKSFGFVISPGEEITLEYDVQLHADLQPSDFTLASAVFYETGYGMFSTTFFNQTIHAVESRTNADSDTASQLQTIFGIVCFLFFSYIGLSLITSSSTTNNSTSKSSGKRKTT